MSDFEQDIRQAFRRSDASWGGPIDIGDPKGALTTNDETEASKHGRAISGRKWAGLITGSKGGVVCALA